MEGYDYGSRFDRDAVHLARFTAGKSKSDYIGQRAPLQLHGSPRPKREKHLHVPALPGTHASGEGFRRHNKLEKRNGR